MKIKQSGDTRKSKNYIEKSNKETNTTSIKKSDEQTNTTSNYNKYISSTNLTTERSPSYHFIVTNVKPHIFLTLTCNSEWSIVTENALHLKNQKTSDIENLTFHQRLEAHLHNLRK